MSRSDTLTEKSLIDLEKRLKKEYTEAQRAVSKKTAQYFKVYADREQDLIDRLEKGEVNLLPNETPESYLKKWRSAQLGRGERWKALKNDLADRMTRTNEIASAYINDRTPSIYSINQSYQAYEIGKGLEGISFTLYDEQTVKNLIADNDERFTSFKTVKVNPKRDYEWNAKQIQHKLVSGILQGQTIKEISAGFLDVMQRNESSALRNARTAYTSAQNGGRIDGMRQAKAQGIEIRKQWLSSHDGRVRDSHAMLNGQIRDIEDRFDNGLMYPADSEGRPAEVYNCRCTLTYIYPKYDKDQSSEIYADEKLEGETYPQFVKRMNKDNADLIAQNKKRYENGEDAGAPKTQKAQNERLIAPKRPSRSDYNDEDIF